MILAYSMPGVSGVAMNQGAMTSATPANLYDGRPGTVTAFTTPSSLGQTLRFTVSLATPINPALWQYIAIRLDNVKVSGGGAASVGITLLGPGNVFAPAGVVVLDCGYPSRTILIPRATFGPGFTSITGVRIDITNPVSASPATVGEIYISGAINVPMRKYDETPTDAQSTRRTISNSPWPLFMLPYRVSRVDFTPVTRAEAFVTNANWGKSLRDILFAMSRADRVLVIPFYRNNKGSADDQAQINATAYLARVMNIDGLESDAKDNRWPITAAFEELL